MQIYHDITEVTKNENTVITIGTFDGFHVGHQQIIQKVVDNSKKINGRNFVITFEPHPRSVVSKDYQIKLLTLLNEKSKLLEEAGIENLLVINFTKEFSLLSSEEFLKKYLIEKIGLKQLIIGHDHRLGKGRDGDENKIKELGEKYNFEVIPVPEIKVDGEIVSSTKIRNALSQGEIEKVNKFINRYYSFSGKVVKGAMRGRTLGFPTANIQPEDPNKMIPAKGVYVVEFILSEGKFFGLMNIGLRPTFQDVIEQVIEIYLFDFNKDIYGENADVKVIKKIRDEKKFNSKEELINQIEEDKKQTLEYLKSFN